MKVDVSVVSASTSYSKLSNYEHPYWQYFWISVVSWLTVNRSLVLCSDSYFPHIQYPITIYHSSWYRV